MHDSIVKLIYLMHFPLLMIVLSIEASNELGYFDMDNMGLTYSRLMSHPPNPPSPLDTTRGESNAATDLGWQSPSSPTGITGGTNNESLAIGERSLFSEWSSLTSSSMQGGRRSVGNVSEIWEPPNMGSGNQDTASKWPSTFETPVGDSAAVGSGSRGVNNRMSDGLADLGFCSTSTTARSSDVHREVEVFYLIL